VHPYPKHLDSFDYLGLHRYFLTFCTHDRQSLFHIAAHVALVESHFLQTAEAMGFADLAHCFMPDHLHAAVEGRDENADLKAFVARMKQYTEFHFKKTFGRQLWQRYGYEHVIRHDEPTRAIIRYILENPIRAGLVRAVG
jgi:REP-associated tyrosine transposase